MQGDTAESRRARGADALRGENRNELRGETEYLLACEARTHQFEKRRVGAAHGLFDGR